MAYRARLLASVCASVVLASGIQVRAQEATPPAEDVAQDAADENLIVVTGIRAALRSAEDRKRQSDVVIDGINSDDIGLLPDVSISESLTRIAGVTANDTARGSDQVAIRGLGPDLASTEYNGRILPTVDGVNRRVGLSGLPSEGLRGAYVQKTPDGGTIEGGVAGILSLESIRPLETRRDGLVLVVRGLTEDLAQDFKAADINAPYGWRAEATYVRRLADNLGISVTYAGLENYNNLSGVQLENWREGSGARNDLDGNGVPDVLPITAGPINVNFNTERHNVLGMVQWEPSPWLTISADGLFSNEQNRNHVRRYFAVGPWNGGPLGAPTSFTVENDTVTEFAGTVERYRGVINANRIQDQTWGAGLNFKIDDGGPLTASIDFSHFEASRDRFTPVVFFETDGANPPGQRQEFSYDARDQTNILFGFNNALTADDFHLFGADLTEQNSSDVIQAMRADFQYETKGGFLRSIDFGLRYDNRRHKQDVDQTFYRFGGPGARPDLDASFRETDGNPLAERSGLFGGPTATSFPYYAFDPLFELAQTGDVDDRFSDELGNFNQVEEDSFALYGQANIDLGSLTGNVGLRYVLTDVNVTGLIGEDPANVIERQVPSNYDFLLPSANFRLNLADDLILRLGAARTLSRPLFSEMRVGAAVNVPDDPTLPVNVNTGNPSLQPFTSDGIDLGLEWYADEGTFLSIAGYYKWVSNFTSTQTRNGTLIVPDGTIRDAVFTETINDPETRYFRGFEVQFRKDFDFLPGILSNLGLQANYNYNETDAFEVFPSLAGPPAVATTVEVTPINLSAHVINGILYYDSKPLNFRLAYRRYSEYSRRFSRGYQFQPGGQLDFNFGVRLTEGVRIIGTVTNITGEDLFRRTEDSRNLDNDAIIQNYSYKGRDFALGVRVQF